MQAGGADGVSFSDPIADGLVIQGTYAVALQNRVDYATILSVRHHHKVICAHGRTQVITTLDLHMGKTKSYKMLAKPVPTDSSWSIPTEEALGFLPREMRERWRCLHPCTDFLTWPPSQIPSPTLSHVWELLSRPSKGS